MVHPTDASGEEHQRRPHLPGAHLPHGLVTFPRRVLPWVEPWFFAYACLGVVQGGMLPMLLPLSAGGSSHAGTIVGVMNLAGLRLKPARFITPTIAPAWVDPPAESGSNIGSIPPCTTP